VCTHKNEKQCANRYFGHKFCFKRKGVAEAKIEVLEYVELIGSASQNGNNIYVFYLQKENADHISIVATIYMCSICKKKMQIIFRFLVEKKERRFLLGGETACLAPFSDYRVLKAVITSVSHDR